MMIELVRARVSEHEKWMTCEDESWRYIMLEKRRRVKLTLGWPKDRARIAYFKQVSMLQASPSRFLIRRVASSMRDRA